uniref:Ac78 n=1 Tax=Lymantria dispar multicapsid nuclear polyhedrosis virus TaxID=10449 RepID=A0A2S1XB10_NPVLD|nr:ac78 [Lymantria dispar multiple nucleopolyhedrovirus]WAK98436.1 ORF87 AcOrf-78 [Lymantria dispar multiple nucleopolyhedrovirus]WAK98587.1 ORF87 AcOrf-78 [Lymantria dispar multiple nucleopolyhedrovirus]
MNAPAASPSLDVPYEQLNEPKVMYIPLKLALRDDDDAPAAAETGGAAPKNALVLEPPRHTDAAARPRAGADVLVMALLSVFCIVVLVYAIYYFVILRERRKLFVNQPKFI